jgi:hypothetical protein
MPFQSGFVEHDVRMKLTFSIPYLCGHTLQMNTNFIIIYTVSMRPINLCRISAESVMWVNNALF